MRRTRRLFLAGLLSLLALAPGAAVAGSTTEQLAGVEYALGTCAGGSTGSFAGYGSLTAGGAPNAVFNTTICHTAFSAERTAAILPGGSFTLVRSDVTLGGTYI